MMHLVQGAKIVELLAPQATNANPASDRVDLGLCSVAFFVIHVTKGNAALTSFALEQATTAAGGGNKIFANTVPIWSNLNCTATDTLVRRTNALSYALDNAADGRGQIVVFQIDPARLDINAGFRYVRFQVAAGDAANIASAMAYLVDHRYQQATPPTAIA